MGCKSSTASQPPPRPSTSATPVILNVYNLTPMNNWTYWFGFGIFHSGIEVYGMEYGFGAHDYPTSGVFEVEPKGCPGFSYRCSFTLGHTNMLPFEFREFIDHIAQEYHGDAYHLILKNCNHFTDDLAMRLTGTPIPKWVNRLAYLSGVCCCLLPKTLRIEAVKGEHAYHGLPNDSPSEAFSVICPHNRRDSGNANNETCVSSQTSDPEVALMHSP